MKSWCRKYSSRTRLKWFTVSDGRKFERDDETEKSLKIRVLNIKFASETFCHTKQNVLRKKAFFIFFLFFVPIFPLNWGMQHSLSLPNKIILNHNTMFILKKKRIKGKSSNLRHAVFPFRKCDHFTQKFFIAKNSGCRFLYSLKRWDDHTKEWISSRTSLWFVDQLY